MKLRTSNYECRMVRRPAAVPFVIRHSLFIIFSLLFGTASYALPSRKTSDEIPSLVPPLPEIPPTFFEQHGWMLWFLIPLVLTLAAVITAICLRPRKPPVLPATAAETLAALTGLQARPEDGATLSQISQLLRRYLITAFWLHPAETTTAEFCTSLTTNTKVGAELSGAIAEFLRSCDERKFSPGQSAPPLDAARWALKLVELAEARRATRQIPA